MGLFGKEDRVSATFQLSGQYRVTCFAPGVSQMGGIDGIAVPRDISD